jgi:hypothetical protein
MKDILWSRGVNILAVLKYLDKNISLSEHINLKNIGRLPSPRGIAMEQRWPLLLLHWATGSSFLLLIITTMR